MKKQHSRVPQSKLLKQLESTTEKLQYAAHTKQVVKNLVDNQPEPKSLRLWLKRGVFDSNTYKPQAYKLPTPPKDANLTEDE